MVKVRKISWLSEEAKEAKVYLSDGRFEIVCFSHPFNQSVGDEVTLPIYTLNAKGIYTLIGDELFSVEKEGREFEYKFSGQVINKNCNQVKIGDFIIELDVPLPNDIQIESYVSFTCDRLNIY